MIEDEIVSSSGNIYHDLGVEAPWWANRIEALEAENARLREALHAIKSPHQSPPHGDEPDGRLINFYAQWVMQCQDTASAAIGEKP